MAVYRNKSKDIPEDAVLLSQDQALAYHWKLVEGWENTSEVWALRFAAGTLGALSAATGVYINHHYRTKLKLGNYGKLSSYLPIVVLPAIMSTVYHKGFVQKQIMTNMDVCPVCVQVRAAAFQTGFGIIYPTILAPLSAFMFATRHFTYRLPSVIDNPKEVFSLIRKMTKPITFKLGIFAIVHSLLAMFLTFKEMENFYEMQIKLQKEEEQLMHGA